MFYLYFIIPIGALNDIDKEYVVEVMERETERPGDNNPGKRLV